MLGRPPTLTVPGTVLVLLAGSLIAACSNGDAPRSQVSEAVQAGAHPAQTAAESNARIAAEVRSELGQDPGPALVVYKTPTCGCCQDWVDHVEEAGFATEVHDVDHHELAVKRFEHGLASDLQSCHSTIVDGYLVEGHVPADAIARLLRERPDIAGISVPGMPMGSPGMEGGRVDPFDVIAYGRDGERTIFASY